MGLLANQRLPLHRVAEHFRISRPAVSRHIRILEECRLVVVQQQGRERFCEARLDRLNEVSEWAEQARRTWEGRLERLDGYLKELQSK